MARNGKIFNFDSSWNKICVSSSRHTSVHSEDVSRPVFFQELQRMRIHIIQHMPFESVGHLSKWVNQPDNFVTVSHPYRTEWYPALECFDLCIVLGGSMSAKDTQKYPP